ncbi:murein transglycosylase A [Desulfovibrionales bacterium]
MNNVWLALFLFLCGCAPQHVTPGHPALARAQADTALARQVAKNMASSQDAVRLALEQSLRYARAQKSTDTALTADGIACSWSRLAATLEHLRALLPRLDTEPELLAQDFAWYQIAPAPLLTGYYEPEIEASLTPDPDFPVPLHGLPPTLRSVDLGAFHPRWKGQTLIYRQTEQGIAPFFSRAEIDGQHALEGLGTPIAWAKDWVDVFFLHIQGSGRLIFPDGTVRHILYAGKNGREYVSLGRVMLEQGRMARAEVSMQSLRAYLHAHPESVRELLDTNPSYVFFRLAENGPFGSMGCTLTPMVSMATDPAFLPLGTALALDVLLPESSGPDKPARFLGLAQDRGGAITGTRLDLFCGVGPEATYRAGQTQAQARAYVLLKK